MAHELSEEPMSRLSSLLTSLWGMTVLNAELKSTNSILTSGPASYLALTYYRVVLSWWSCRTSDDSPAGESISRAETPL